MEILLQIITGILSGGMAGNITKGVLLLMIAGAYFYAKYLISKKQKEIAQKQSEDKKIKDQAGLQDKTKSANDELKEGEL